jgi:hypothetical protein
MSEDPRKVIARLRTATLPRLAEVMTVCDELESQLSTVAPTKIRRCGFYKGCGIYRVPGMRRTARS